MTSLELDANGRPLTPVLAVGEGAGCADSLAVTVAVGAPVPAATCQVDDVDAYEEVAAAVHRAPLAAIALNGLLRQTERLDVPLGLLAESATYSMLLRGPEFCAWLQERGSMKPAPTPEPVRVSREGDTLHVVLNRPQRRNAVDAAMRDALIEALTPALYDDALAVEIRGAGPHFCSGGDLAEFGTAPDPATAHVVRSAHSVGRLIDQIRDRVRVDVHGSSIGAGVEMAAFAGIVRCTPDATFQLPELGLGLVPGAGGTVSVTRRIGRQRTAWMALTGATIDADTALEWGLVDAILS